MRPLPLLLAALLAGCAAQQTSSPSLLPRPAEAIDPRVPVPDMIVSADASLDLVRQLDALVAQAEAGDQAFRGAAATAERLASTAGAPRSESWVVAQQALSAAVAARAPVTRAVADIDGLGARRVQALGGIGAGDLAAIKSAAARVAQIDDREAAVIDRIQARLGG